MRFPQCFSDHVLLSRIHFFFFNDTATTEIYTLSLHDALPISARPGPQTAPLDTARERSGRETSDCGIGDRKSTRLNSSHLGISYAVFCLKKNLRRGRADLGLARQLQGGRRGARVDE